MSITQNFTQNDLVSRISVQVNQRNAKNLLEGKKNVPEDSKNIPQHSNIKSKNKTTIAQKIRKLKAQVKLNKFIIQHTHKVLGGYQQNQFDLNIHTHRKIYSIIDQNTKQKSIDIVKPHYDKLFQNQTDFALEIVDKFCKDTKMFSALAMALTQCGKTGTMLAVIYNAILKLNVKLENIFIITAYSSKLWVKQTKDRLPKQLHQQIFHRNTLHNFVKIAKNKQNLLIITDETHIAVKKGQALHKVFSKLNLFDIKHIYENDIKFVHFTATPNNIIHDLNQWKFGHHNFIMKTPNTYVSIFDLLNQGNIIQSLDLCGVDIKGNVTNNQVQTNIRQILKHIKINDPKFHIIRTHNGKLHEITINNFKNAFQNLQFQFISETKIKNIDKFISNKPNKHTFIFIKEKLRCAKTLHKNHIGILYERHVKKHNTDAIVQGLTGRATGYHNHNIIVFANIHDIAIYKKQWNNISLNNSQISNFKNSIFTMI